MPDLNQLPVPQYEGNQPYHWEYDNVPINSLTVRDEIVNDEVDLHGKILRESCGTQGTLSNRLNQFVDQDGNLIPDAIDQALHNIAFHSDGSKTVSDDELADYIDLGFPELTNPVNFVRMLQSERDKLALIADEATNMTISVGTPSTIVWFEEGPVHLVESSSIKWEVSAPNNVQAVLAISTDFAHRHYYDLEPITMPSDDVVPVLNKLYKVNYTATPFIEDSLRVYINGVRLSSNESIYYPSNPIETWTLNKFTADAENGKFTLDNAITDDDIIIVDFDVSLT